MNKITGVKGILIDLEGVLYSDNKLIPGSIDIIKELKKRGLKLNPSLLIYMRGITAELRL